MKTCNCFRNNVGSDMKVRIIVVAVLALLMSAFFLTGCNTWKGAGKDVERTGEAMQGSDED